MSKNKSLIFNSYPRSGNVYLTNICSLILDNVNLNSIHIPEIYDNTRLNMVAIFRHPAESIASLIYKHGGHVLDRDEAIETFIDDFCFYVDEAIAAADNLYICDFRNAKDDSVSEILKIAKHFNLPVRSTILSNDRAYNSVHNLMARYNLLSDEDGHMPRDKSNLRKEIDSYVAEYPGITRAIDAYNKLIFR